MPSDEYARKAKLNRVVDGDTVDLDVDLGYSITTKQRFRLLGIDTPERGQVGFNEAKRKMEELLQGQSIIVVSTKEGKYGRYLGQLYVGTTDINQTMLDLGLAVSYDGGKRK